jgi:hypothetical protein
MARGRTLAIPAQPALSGESSLPPTRLFLQPTPVHVPKQSEMVFKWLRKLWLTIERYFYVERPAIPLFGRCDGMKAVLLRQPAVLPASLRHEWT